MTYGEGRASAFDDSSNGSCVAEPARIEVKRCADRIGVFAVLSAVRKAFRVLCVGSSICRRRRSRAGSTMANAGWRRINSADSLRLAHAHRFRQRQKLNNDSQVSALKEVEESETALIRDRGYRLRCAELALTENHSIAVMGRRRDHLIGLAAFRLLCHVRSALADFESTTVRCAAKDVL